MIRPCSSADCIVKQCCELLDLKPNVSKEEIIQSYNKFKLGRIAAENPAESASAKPAVEDKKQLDGPNFDWRQKYEQESPLREFKLKLNAYEFLISQWPFHQLGSLSTRSLSLTRHLAFLFF